jgi:hypothetical protein
MWLITNRGYFSAVQDKDDPNVIVIRARTDRHLNALMDLLPEGTKISTDEGRATDYPCRVRVGVEEWLWVAAKLAAEVDYTNFKDSVERGKRGKALKDARHDHDVYLRVWGVLHALTSKRESTAQRRRRRKHARGRYVPRDPQQASFQDFTWDADPWR